MSSHRAAPEISKVPVADSTDLYAFVSPDQPDTVTIIANYVPLESPGGGPNFYEFGDDVLYEIKIDNNGDGKPEISYQFTFTNKITNPDTFLYNTGPIQSLTDKNWTKPFVAGVIDVKSTVTESADEVADRIRQVLEYVPADRLGLSTDCGLINPPRLIAVGKLRALNDGAALVPADIAG